MAKWVEIRKGADFQSIGEKVGISSLTARLIRNKDITEESEIRQYLYGGLSDLCSASVMKGIIPAVEILQKKIKQHEKLHKLSDHKSSKIAIYLEQR